MTTPEAARLAEKLLDAARIADMGRKADPSDYRRQAAAELLRLSAQVAALSTPAVSEHDELARDPDGDIALDWQTRDGDMLSMSLSKEGRLAWAVHRAGPAGSGTVHLNEACFWLLNQVLDESTDPSPQEGSQAGAEVARDAANGGSHG
jgi:hypothetical protein